jgi:DNA-binding NarL/FixJ family response regulator
MQSSQFIPCPTTTPLPSPVQTVLVCESQPVVAAGVEALINGHTGMRIAESTHSLVDALDAIRETPVDLVVLDKAFGMRAIGDFRTNIKETGCGAPKIIVWGATISPAEASQLLNAGVRGIHLKTAGVSGLVACLRTVAMGRVWMEEGILRERSAASCARHSVTARERQVLALLEQGLGNRAIAQQLEIKPGTVKIHMKHLFEKTGIRGRNSLALASMMSDSANERSRNFQATSS